MLKKTPVQSQPAGAPDVVNPILLGGKLMDVLQLTGAGIRDQHIPHTPGSPCTTQKTAYSRQTNDLGLQIPGGSSAPCHHITAHPDLISLQRIF